jgi:hypothetical protein
MHGSEIPIFRITTMTNCFTETIATSRRLSLYEIILLYPVGCNISTPKSCGMLQQISELKMVVWSRYKTQRIGDMSGIQKNSNMLALGLGWKKTA